MINPSTLYGASALILILVGLATALLKRDLIKMTLGFSILSAGVHLLIVALGYIKGGTAPIIDKAEMLKGASDLTVSANVMDPVPQAMVLTAIVIGVGTTALMLAVIVRLYARHKTLDVNTLARLKW
ncbi:sodium:proton antiporter [Myxococcota bacterium]|nr:sodium:proton antiporter [Myxococcota bacterium]MBU1896653.1 sodium:proton antiporter [Myxococcota bacterium]